MKGFQQKHFHCTVKLATEIMYESSNNIIQVYK